MKTREGRRFRLARKLLRDKSIVFGGVIVIAYTIIAIFAPSFVMHDPYVMDFEMHDPPSYEHPFGTDGYGRDVLSRVIMGSRISLIIGITVVVVRGTVGITLGLLAGYYGGWVDVVIMRITDVFLSIPTLILAMGIMAILGGSFVNLLLALSIKNWTSFARVTRSEVLSLKENVYIEAARACGVPNRRIIFSHILRNLASTLFVYGSMNVAYPILGETFLSFLGLGLDPPTISWGRMLALDRAYLTDAWWSSVFPGLAVLTLVLAFNLMGDGLRDVFDPQMVDVEGR